MHVIEILKEISILISIWVAICGIDSWRREHVGKRKIELAEDILASFYEARDVIKYMRCPVSLSHETDNIKRGDKETEEEYQDRRNASIVFKRYNEHVELFNKLHAMRYRFMVQVGKNESKPFDDLRTLINGITLSARCLPGYGLVSILEMKLNGKITLKRLKNMRQYFGKVSRKRIQ